MNSNQPNSNHDANKPSHQLAGDADIQSGTGNRIDHNENINDGLKKPMTTDDQPTSHDTATGVSSGQPGDFGNGQQAQKDKTGSDTAGK